MTSGIRVLVVESWFGGSHRNAIEGIAAHSIHRFELVSLPARFWKWRMQGSAVDLASKTRDLISSGYCPNVLLASSLVNLPAYLALTRRLLTGIPAVLYMHENQLTYALPNDSEPDYTYGFINYLSCLAADAVAFNSSYHRVAFMDALHALLERLPDYVHEESVAEIRAKSSVLHLGIDCAALDNAAVTPQRDPGFGKPLTILWNHRWEYDKNPESFFRVVDRLDDAGYPFNLVLLGEDFSERPPVFGDARRRYAERILAFGWESSPETYRQWLHRSDVVVSTAVQEFFGIAVMEAVYCGCHPLLPDRLSYPELTAALGGLRAGYAPFLYDTEDGLFDILAGIASGTVRRVPRDTLRQAATRFDWRSRAYDFDRLLGVVARGDHESFGC